MTRTVHCRKYKKELPGLDMPPLPGAKGQKLFNEISQQAWQEWIKYQTMLINEKHLNLMDPASRTYLSEQMDKFFDGADIDEVEGYVPPEKQ